MVSKTLISVMATLLLTSCATTSAMAPRINNEVKPKVIYSEVDDLIYHEYDFNYDGFCDYREGYHIIFKEKADKTFYIVTKKFPYAYQLDTNMDQLFDEYETLIDSQQDGINGNEVNLGEYLFNQKRGNQLMLEPKKERKWKI